MNDVLVLPTGPLADASLALVRSTEPATGAAMFTANRVQAAPVKISKEHLELAEPQAVVATSGNANAATGLRGELDARATAAETARLLGLDAEQFATALGIAGTQAAGLKSMFGTMCKPLHAGKAAYHGLLAARLAKRGFTTRV